MVSGFSFPRRLSWLILLCVGVMMLAWAAPLLVGALPDSHLVWSPDSNQTVTDPHDVHTHLGEMLDEPLIFPSIGGAILHRLMSSFLAARPTIWTRSPLPLIHPPSILISI